MPNPARRAVALAVLAAAIIAGAVALDLPSAAAQSDEQTGRIVAQRLADGRTEFGWQPSGGARVLPRARYFPTDAQVGRWLNSSPVEVEGEAIGRINARLLDDGRIEFAFTPTDGERILPPSRYFPRAARVGRWLRSTEITISAAPVTGFVAIATSVYNSCAIRAGTGAIECWGRGGSRNEGGLPDAPAGSFTAVAAYAFTACAIRAGTGTIECWGEYLPPDVLEGSFTAVAAGGAHSCGLRTDGAIQCWGSNTHPLPGPEELPYIGQATPPTGSFSAVAAGFTHSCAIRTNGAITCWGSYNDDAPTGRFTAIAAGHSHTCAIQAGNGAIECWGSNIDRESSLPTGSFSAVSAGWSHTCAIQAGNGAIECWGLNRYGQTDAPAGSFTAIAADAFHSCGLRESGAIECWGDNEYGQTNAPAP